MAGDEQTPASGARAGSSGRAQVLIAPAAEKSANWVTDRTGPASIRAVQAAAPFKTSCGAAEFGAGGRGRGRSTYMRRARISAGSRRRKPPPQPNLSRRIADPSRIGCSLCFIVTSKLCHRCNKCHETPRTGAINAAPAPNESSVLAALAIPTGVARSPRDPPERTRTRRQRLPGWGWNTHGRGRAGRAANNNSCNRRGHNGEVF